MDRVVEVVPLPDYRLQVRFQDGTEGTVSLKDELYGPVFEPLRDPDFFVKVMIDEHGAVCWPIGADMAPDALYDDIRSAQKERSPAALSTEDRQVK